MEEPTTRAPTELELLKMRMNKTTDESVESTRRMVQLCDESQTVGAATMVQLGEQREQLQRVDEHMDNIHEDVRAAERNLEELDKCCGLCVCPWNRSKKHKSDAAFKPRRVDIPDYKAQYGQQQQQTQPSGHAMQQQPTIPGDGRLVTRILDDAREDEMEDNLHQVSHMVGGLKDLATDMNQEIRSQNTMLERIDKKADSNQQRIGAAQKRADNILGKPSKPADSTPGTASMGMAAAKYMMP